jgi:general secretion pathway protein A
VQTILLGQPQFRPILASRDAEQLRQRVLASFHLGPLADVETRLYIEHRLKTVGWTGNPHWDEDAFAAVHRHTGGTPRRINTLCSRIMQLGALDQRTDITAEMVNEVAEEMTEGLNGAEPVTRINGPEDDAAEDGRNGYKAFRPGAMGGPNDLLHRIEALEEVTARQDRVFQRIVRMLSQAVEKGT